MCTLASSVVPLHGQQTVSDTLPSAVVQRFVNAANARNIDAMMATVAPGAIFRVLPVGNAMAVGRDSVRLHYEHLFARAPKAFYVHVASRIVDGMFVVDFEQFTGTSGSMNTQATWIYQVTGGLIQNAWVLRQPPPDGR
jgi:hypothetical protein